jgi:hypothetical protein
MINPSNPSQEGNSEVVFDGISAEKNEQQAEKGISGGEAEVEKKDESNED